MFDEKISYSFSFSTPPPQVARAATAFGLVLSMNLAPHGKGGVEWRDAC